MKTQHVNWCEQLEIACAAKHAYGVFVAGDQYDFDDEHSMVRLEFVKDSLFALYGVTDGLRCVNSILDRDLLLFETEEEAEKFYGIFESGLTDTREYACLISPVSGIITENT